MKQYYAGLDLGTSSVKILLATTDGEVIKVKQPYEEVSPRGWQAAVLAATTQLSETVDLRRIAALGLSAQVGTYITDTGTVIGWNASAGASELAEIRQAVQTNEFVAELAMDHPDIISYPLPRLLHIRRQDRRCRQVLMPKELLVRILTGRIVTDRFSQRGLAHTGTGQYSKTLLDRFGLDFELPPVVSPTDCVGTVTPQGTVALGFAEHTPVYCGCNDFFAGLLGMGVLEPGTLFDLTGTSEHIGLISHTRQDGHLVSGPYLEHYVTYGGTKASGTSAAFAARMFGETPPDMTALSRKPPIFLPYLSGERAPIYDEAARGVFFGIDADTDKAALSYAVLEGIVFSLYHIAQAFPSDSFQELILGGGAANNRLLTRLKADLFGCSIRGAAETDTSAMGAAMLAMVGSGRYRNIRQAIDHTVTYRTLAEPDVRFRELLLRRFEIYRGLYSHLKADFAQFSK